MDGWSLGGSKYRAAYAANKTGLENAMQKLISVRLIYLAVFGEQYQTQAPTSY